VSGGGVGQGRGDPPSRVDGAARRREDPGQPHARAAGIIGGGGSLDPEDFAVDDDIRRAEGLPARAFTDPAFLARELDTIFERAWLFAPEPAGAGGAASADDARPLLDQVAARGARVPLGQLGRPLFLQRGWDDEALRCFANTCTHAWYPLVIGASRGPTLVCAQHGRRFDCAGRYLSQPGFQGLPDFPRDCDHLAEIGCDTWRGSIFTRFTAGGASLADTLAPVDESLARWPAALARTAAPGELRDVAGNWKQHVWNYLDRFHVSFIHRAPGGLADVCDMSSYTTELHGDSVLQWVYASRAEDGFEPDQLPARFADAAGGRRVFALWWYVWPNLTLNYYPWGLSINVYQPIAGRPGDTRFLWYHHVMDAAKHAERDRRWLSAQVDAEDIDALAQVSRGLRSGKAVRGRFAPGEEQAAHWFHRRIARAVFA
jgi:phenylpropionate dioxygenase-like ring-hydroxylating dioxygenase large terminal subunit